MARTENRGSWTRQCIYISLSFSFYIAIFIHTLGWHDSVLNRQRVSDYSHDHLASTLKFRDYVFTSFANNKPSATADTTEGNSANENSLSLLRNADRSTLEMKEAATSSKTQKGEPCSDHNRNTLLEEYVPKKRELSEEDVATEEKETPEGEVQPLADFAAMEEQASADEEEEVNPLEESASSSKYIVDEDEPKPKVTLLESITPENPVFVWSLPNSGGLAMQRYFKCGGLDEESLGRLWTKDNLYSDDLRKKMYMGKCIEINLQNAHAQPHVDMSSVNLLEGCGRYRVWTEMEFVSKGTPKEILSRGRICSFPTLRHGMMNKILQAYPNATVINVLRDPEEWYDTLSPGMKERWPRYCNNNPYIYKFPEANATKDAWVAFYNRHSALLRKKLSNHPSVKFIEIDLQLYPGASANSLEEHLGIPRTCWTRHALQAGLPNDIGYPIFVPSLPKSATSTVQKYLNCGMGYHEGAHQWTQRAGTHKDVRIGECMRDNMQQNRPIFENCGDHKHWSDWGVLTSDDCFYPSMHGHALEAIYKAHPYGTILNTIRDARSWYQSALRWSELNIRMAKTCKGFPGVRATEEEWIDFYNWHTDHIREFARKHPTMTYVEVFINNATETRQTLAENFAFPGRCWGHRNNNSNNQEVEKRRARDLKVKAKKKAKKQTMR